MVKMIKFAAFLTLFAVCQSKSLDRQISCSMLPSDALKCIGSPEILDRNNARECGDGIDLCALTTCTFKKAGWIEKGTEKLDKKKITEYFEQYAKDHRVWSTAVQAVKSTCLGQDLLPQGGYLNCPAYDVVHCVSTSFLKNAGSQWSPSANCQNIKGVVEACPVCPSECFAPAIPIGSCNACYAQPPKTA